jgi:glycosyltransferase involved in cell wall biosynthesis
MTTAPIVLFTYNRLDTLMKCVTALSFNVLAEKSDLFVFSDGPKGETDIEQVEAVRAFLKQVTGFKSVKVIKRQKNLGLANSIKNGVDQVIHQFGKVIVLEDDLITSANFLLFMNKALEYYACNNKICSISGYSPPMLPKDADDVYYTMRGSSWGWATWRDRWIHVDWEVNNYLEFIASSRRKRCFNKMGSDMCKMLNDQMTGKINSWAIRWSYWQFDNGLYTVFPVVSKVRNIGTSKLATNTKDNFNRFRTDIDKTDNDIFKFRDDIILEDRYMRPFLRQFSVTTRIKYKVLNFLFNKTL